jgi:hypothetical protein
MPDAFFLGGFAKGMESAEAARDASRRTTVLEKQQQIDIDLKNRAMANDEARTKLAGLEPVHKAVNDALKFIDDTAKEARAAGATPEQIEALITPVARSAAATYQRAGGDPSAILTRIATSIGTPAAAQTELGKLEADRRAGLIDDATYQAKVKALTTEKGSVTNINLSGDKAFATELNKELAKGFVERRTGATDALASLKATEEATALLDTGVITGKGADLLLQTGKALQRIGINIKPDAIANTEAFVATRAQEVGRIIKLFGAGTGLSDADREFATRAAAGDITLDEQSIRRILDINARAARNIVRAYNDEAAKIDPGAVPFDLRLPEIPEAPKAEQVIRKTINGKNYIKRSGQWFEE